MFYPFFTCFPAWQVEVAFGIREGLAFLDPPAAGGAVGRLPELLQLVLEEGLDWYIHVYKVYNSIY